MRKSWLVFSLVAVAVWAASPGSQAQDSDPAGDSFLETLNDKVSYTLGFQLAKSFGTDIEFDMLKRGYDDALAKKKSPLREAEMRKAMQDFQRQVDERAAKANKQAGEAFLAANKKMEGVVTLPSGLQYKVLKRGQGPSPAATDTVTAHYHGTLVDGTVFDSSVDRGQPATFQLNRVRLKGWTEGLQLMKVGGKWTFYIPSNLAYGPERKSEKIGPNSTLIFEVEIKSIKGN